MDNTGFKKLSGSTGPKTTKGKAVIAQNALKHGGFSEAIPILGEDPDAFEALQEGMATALQPIGPLEEELVDRLSRLWWRLERLGRAEREGLWTCLSHELWRRQVEQVPNPAHLAFFLNMGVGDGHHTERLQRHEAQLERSFFRILHELERLQAQCQGRNGTRQRL
jgi:hypothetical protein